MDECLGFQLNLEKCQIASSHASQRSIWDQQNIGYARAGDTVRSLGIDFTLTPTKCDLAYKKSSEEITMRRLRRIQFSSTHATERVVHIKTLVVSVYAWAAAYVSLDNNYLLRLTQRTAQALTRNRPIASAVVLIFASTDIRAHPWVACCSRTMAALEREYAAGVAGPEWREADF